LEEERYRIHLGVIQEGNSKKSQAIAHSNVINVISSHPSSKN